MFGTVRRSMFSTVDLRAPPIFLAWAWPAWPSSSVTAPWMESGVGGKEADVDDDERQRVYASFEAARLGKNYEHASNPIFLNQWHAIEGAQQPFLVDLLRGMVAAASAQRPRLSGEAILSILEQHPFSLQELSTWENRLTHFRVERIDQAKRQVSLVQAALVSRKRLRAEVKL